MPPKKKSNVEAMQRYRQRLKSDPSKYEQYKQKERERYYERKRCGKIQQISNLPQREQRSLRRKWRIKQRERRGMAASSSSPEVFNTPPNSPSPVPIVDIPPQPSVPCQSGNRGRGRRQIQARNRKAYRTVNEQKAKIQQLTKQINQLKYRLRKANKSNQAVSTSTVTCRLYTESDSVTGGSPNTQAESLLSSGDKKTIKRQLTFGYALCNDVRKKLQASVKTHREKQSVHRILTGKLLKKYGLLSCARKHINLSQREIHQAAISVDSDSLQQERKPTQSRVAPLVTAFYLQDVNSCPAPGKGETMTKNKLKMQKRYLCDSMSNLHHRFLAENPFMIVSYATFARLRPFYVIPPSVNHRDTVKCKLHHNLEFKAIKLHQLGILHHKSPYNIMQDVVCSVMDKNCMYRECDECQSKWVDLYKDMNRKSSSEVVMYFEWQREQESRVNTHGKTIIVSVMKKTQKEATIAELCKIFEIELKLLMPHQYRIWHQFNSVRAIKQKLTPGECVLQIDFSENYCCKAETEIQSMHFGGSRKQISLHTCHATFQDGIKCYCTVSEDIRHTAEAVWAHLSPVLDSLSTLGIDIIHFVSDGPTTQYKNKTNFYLFSQLPFTKWNFKTLTYNFLEAGHGKGPADGIGAAVKCCADRLVAHGEDILDCKKFIESVRGKVNVDMYEVSSGSINAVGMMIENARLQQVKGTMKVHQLMASRAALGTVYHRPLSCFCTSARTEDFCECYFRKEFIVQVENNSALVSIENKIGADLVNKFHQRYAEGYDVTIDDLNTLDEQARKEYLLFKSWRAAKLLVRHVQKPIDTSTDSELESLASDTSNPSEDSDWNPENQYLSPKADMSGSIPELHSYYAVFFFARSSKKGTFYIGRVLSVDHSFNTCTLKFLERKCGTTHTYDWPRRDDISSIDNNYILQMVEFEGPPPFSLSGSQLSSIQNHVENFSLKPN